MSSSESSTRADLAVVEVAISKIEPNDYNPNRQSETVARAEKESIEHFGFIDPIAVRKDPDRRGRYIIVDGEHRYRTAKDLGYTSLPVIVLDVDEAQAKKLTVVLNETRGDPDQLLLAQLLNDLSSLDDFEVALPYTSKELDQLLSFAREPQPDQGDGDSGSNGSGKEAPVEKDVTLTFGLDRHEQFKTWTTMLEVGYGLTALSDVVYEAVRREALKVNQGVDQVVAEP